MIVPDTSAWIELLRGTGSAICLRLHDLLEAREDIATTEVVIAEVLAGERSSRSLLAARRTLLGFRLLTLGGLNGFEHAASIYRTCREAGEKLRGLTDCLVAAPVIQAQASILHRDRDFDVIARHTDLRIEPVA